MNQTSDLFEKLDQRLMAAQAIMSHYFQKLKHIKAHPESSTIDFGDVQPVLLTVQEVLLRKVRLTCLNENTPLSNEDLIELKRKMSEIIEITALGINKLKN